MQMLEISHGKRDKFLLRGKYHGIGWRLLRCNESYRLPSDVISLAIVCRLSLDVISLGTGYLKCKLSWCGTQVVQM